ncbi:MAG: hypothetical protein AUI14_17150 [Actinobacteria bacterium 13_2_20CM_2_71_6]|nr:MAG: hypothetical protein AUI14_17150 [Actinobacteria bacterium 13_2_20CM_2_71_6]
MRAGRRHRAVCVSGQRPDAGFTLIEVLVAITLIGIVMAALATFYTSTVSVTAQQSGKQTAVKYAIDGMERVRGLRGSELAAGRKKGKADPATVPAAKNDLVKNELNSMEEWDLQADPNVDPKLLLRETGVVLNGIGYDRYSFVGKCWSPPAGGACVNPGNTGDVEFYRVVVAVTWPGKNCAQALCAYFTSTLVSDGSGEPIFNANGVALPPTVNNPGGLTGEATVAFSRQLAATGGAPPLTWNFVGLPVTLIGNSSGLISGVPTAAATYTITASATDAFNHTGSATFTITVNPVLVVTTPGAQTGEVGVAVAGLQIVASAGVAPYTWAATGLPPGLSINTSGKITGTPTAAGPYTVKVTVTDAATKAVSTNNFTWTIAAAPTVSGPAGPRTDLVGKALSVQATVSGGTGPFTWTAANLPTGLQISSAGLITGTPSTGTRYLTTLTVTDSLGVANSVTVVWNVPSAGGGMRVNSPTTDRTGDIAGHAITAFTAQASGGSGSYTWSATGLPSGISLSSGGTFSGTPTKAGTSTVRLTARDALGTTAVFMFTWTVQ